MRIAIVDDEILFAKKLGEIIKKKWSMSIESLELFFSAESLLSSSLTFDLLFLDIEMPGVSGLELARKHRKISANIVFVTNRDDLVFEAYNTTSAVGFVRKSKISEDLKRVISRINKNNQQSRGISVKSGGSVAKIKCSDILYIEKVAHNIIIHTENESYHQRGTIADIEAELLPYGFTRTHAGYLVNLSHISLIKSSSAVLTNKTHIPISRNNVKLVKDKFMERNVMINE